MCIETISFRVKQVVIGWVTFLTLASVAQAQLAFNDLTKQDLEDINNEFSNLFAFTSVSSPSSLGSIWGVEVGLIGGMAQSPKIEELAKEADATADVPASLPHGWLLGSLSVPFGITGEVNFIPELDFGDGSFQHTGFAAKWTVTDVFPLPVPVVLATKLTYSTSEFSFTQDIPGGSGEVTYNNSMTGFVVQAGLNMFIVEPYVGLGYVSSTGELGATGSSIFAPGFSADEEESVEESSQVISLGAQANLLFLRLGLEYQSAFGTDRISGKLSFKF